MVINVLVQKQIVIDIIVNVYRSGLFCIIVIVKIVKISHLKIVRILHLSQINQKLKKLLALVLKVVAIKSIVNAIKMENSENGKKYKDVLYECCLANSIYIIKNKIIEEEIGEGNIMNDKNNTILMKKRKRTISVQN